jgi:PPK2 family polyphosphate:nucleotide phosphotransferase
MSATRKDRSTNTFTYEAGTRLRLDKIATDADNGFATEEEAKKILQEQAAQFIPSQNRLMAHGTYGLLILFQGMDASGKDESVTYVLSHLDPRGCEFKQFKSLTPKEEKHDYLWRTVAALPARGQIGIFNRSYYEHVVAEQIHPETLESQSLPPEATKDIWAKRYRHIRHFEQYLIENGIHLLKFFLHISKDEQRKRLLERIDNREMQWEFSQRDVQERALWKDYEKVYSEVLTETNTAEAPWYIVPADRPWSTRAVVAKILREKLESFHSGFPHLNAEEQRKMAQARAALEKET